MSNTNPGWLVVGEPGVQSVRSVAGKRGDISLDIADVQTLSTTLSNKINLSAIGAANGVPGLDSNGDLVGRIIVTPTTATNLASMVLASGQLAFNSDTGQFVRGDGVTMGGVPIRVTSVRTITKVSTDASSFFIDHQNADVVLIKCYTNNASKTFNVNAATAGDPLPTGFGSEGIKSGSYVGQKLTVQFDLQATTSDGTTGGVITINLSGNRFGWNAANFFFGVTKRSFVTEPTRSAAGTYRNGQSITLIWDGAYWWECGGPYGMECSNDIFGLAAGAFVKSGDYSIAVGQELNQNSNPQYSAVFGLKNISSAPYNLVGGESNGTGLLAGHSIYWGKNLSGPQPSGNDGYQFVMGNGARPRTPYSRTFGHDHGTGDRGCCQLGDYVYGVVTTDATATVMAIGPGGIGGHLVVAPKTIHNCLYQLTAYNVTDNAVCTVTGRFSVWRDGANNTAILESVEFSRANSAGMAGFGFAISADDVNERPAFTVTGLAGKTIRWSLRLTAVDAAGAAAL